MQPDKLQYILSSALMGTSVTLQYAPDGWDDTLVHWTRSTKYYGLFRSFSVPMRFVKDGKEYLREAFYTYGIEADVMIEIKRLNITTWVYETWYRGEMDFSQYKEQDTFVEINVMEGGLSKIIKSKEDNEFEVPFAVPLENVIPVYGEGSARNAYNVSTFLLRIIDTMTAGGVTAGTYGTRSTYFDSLTDYYPGFLNGREVRTDLLTNFKVKFSDFFQSLNSAENIGFGIEIIGGIETAVIEEKAYFFDKATTILTLPDQREFKINIAKDYIFNSIKISSEQKEYRAPINSIYELNVKGEFSLPIERVKNDLDLTSPFRLDWRGLWDIISAYTNDPELQEDIDNDIFLMCLKQTGGGWTTPDEGEVNKQGIVDPEDWQNIKYSPHRSIVKHTNFLLSVLDKRDGEYIKFISSDGDNVNNQTRRATDMIWVNEYDNIEVVDDGSKLFQPYYFEFESASLLNIQDLINANPNGVIEFTQNGVTLKGFISEVAGIPHRLGVVQYKLLVAPDTDLTQLLI